MNLRLVARWTLASLLLVIALLWAADRIWPLPLPKDDLARVVLAEDGTPLRRFADANGVWRYPVQTAEAVDDKADDGAERLAQPFEKAFYLHVRVLMRRWA